MSTALTKLAELPWALHAVVGLLMAAGIILWLTGERYIKGVVVAFGALVGGMLGVLIISTTGLGSTMSLTIWHGLGIGAFIGLLLGLLMCKSAIALGTGVVFAAMLPLGAAAVLGVVDERHRSAIVMPMPTAPMVVVRDEVRLPSDSLLAMAARFDDARAGSGVGMGVLAMTSPSATLAQTGSLRQRDEADAIGSAINRVREFVNDAYSQASAAWSPMPALHKGVITLAFALGLGGGVILGMSLPKWAGAAVSSLFGAAIWIPCAVWLSSAAKAPWVEQMNRPALHWLIAWLCVGLLGMLVQWSGVLGKGGAKKAAPAPAAKPA